MSKEMTCNVCGKKFDFWDTQENYNIHTYCGYGSKFDGETIDLDICCECFDKLVESCKVSPICKGERDVLAEMRGIRYGFNLAERDEEAEAAVEEVFANE